MACHDEMSYSSQEGNDFWGLGILIQDNTNPITEPYSSSQYVFVINYLFGNLVYMDGSYAAGIHKLGRRLLQSDSTLAVIETHDPLRNGQPAPARRVVLPWGSNSFNNSWLTSEGWDITQRSIEWAAGAL